ncbi:MAG: transcription antitermination factor NusB [Pseudomonadota bacterium]
MPKAAPGIRSRTRTLLVQALYQAAISDDDAPLLLAQFKQRDEYRRVNAEMFKELLEMIFRHREELDELIVKYADRPREQIDPVEWAIMQLGLGELKCFLETPYRVIINESVQIATRFGAEDGHKYVNALLDKAAASLRESEYRKPRS